MPRTSPRSSADAPHSLRARHFAWLAVILVGNVAMNNWRVTDGPLRSWHEAVVLRTAQETWLRTHAGVEDAWLIPYFADHVRVNKPPMTVWLVLLTWIDLEPHSLDADPHQPDQMLARARMVSLALSLLAIVGVFLAASALAGPVTGLFAAGFFASLPIVTEFSQMATHETGLIAGATISVGCAFCAMGVNGASPTRARRMAWWSGCAIALAFAWMTKGPPAPLVVGAGVIPALILAETARRRNIVEFILALIVALALALPWFIMLSYTDEGVAAHLMDTYGPSDFDARPVWYYLYHINWKLPWTVLVLAALFLLIARRAEHNRRRRYIAWAWFLSLFLFFSITPQKVTRYLLPVFPALMIVVAMTWADLHRLIAAGNERAQRVVALHWALVGIASLVVVLCAAFLPQILQREWIDRWRSDIPPPLALAIIGISLITLATWGTIWSWRGESRSAIPAIAWSFIVCSLIAWSRHGPMERARLADLREQAAIMHDLVGSGSAFFRDVGGTYERSELFFYYHRPVGAEPLRTLREMAGRGTPVFFLTASENARQTMERDEFTVVHDAMTFEPPYVILRSPDS